MAIIVGVIGAAMSVGTVVALNTGPTGTDRVARVSTPTSTPRLIPGGGLRPGDGLAVPPPNAGPEGVPTPQPPAEPPAGTEPPVVDVTPPPVVRPPATQPPATGPPVNQPPVNQPPATQPKPKPMSQWTSAEWSRYYATGRIPTV